MDRRSFLKVSAAGAAATAALPRRAQAQDPKTLVVAWDTDIDTLDPAFFKAIGGYVTVANCYDTVIGWKVRPIAGKPGFFRSKSGTRSRTTSPSRPMPQNRTVARPSCPPRVCSAGRPRRSSARSRRPRS